MLRDIDIHVLLREVNRRLQQQPLPYVTETTQAQLVKHLKQTQKEFTEELQRGVH